MLNLEANMVAGDTTTSGGIDADKTSFVIKRAHLDWTIPGTQVKTRLGIQGITMPTVAFGNPVLNADVSGLSVSSQFTPEFGMTAFWARPYDNGFADSTQVGGLNKMDEMDIFGVMLPIKTDAVRATPWGMFALIGKDSGYFRDANKSLYNFRHVGAPAAIGTDKMDSTAYGWWLGSSFELPILDPFFVNIDAMMGGLETGDSDYDTFGWYIAANVGYKFSWGALSAIGWYSSGNDDVDDRGTMPIVSDDGGGNQMTRYGLGQSPYLNTQGALSTHGLGMWGVGLQLADFSFVENLKHTAKILYMGGTNQGDSTPRRSVRAEAGGVQFFGDGYFMTSDRAWEATLLSEYKVNQNLTFYFDLSYIWLDLGDHWRDRNDTEGNFVSAISVIYSF